MTRRRAVAVLVVALLAGCNGRSAAQPHTRAPASAAELPESLTVRGSHSVVIRRRTADAGMRRALAIAERTDPPRDSVLAAMGKAHFKLREEPSDARLWWSSEFDGVRIPYAITDAAVAYYFALSDGLRRGGRTKTNGIRMSRSKLEYVATVERHASFVLGDATYADVYVVRLRLVWDSYCGDLCALSFSTERTVVVDRDGTVRAVHGDGEPDATVS